MVSSGYTEAELEAIMKLTEAGITSGYAEAPIFSKMTTPPAGYGVVAPGYTVNSSGSVVPIVSASIPGSFSTPGYNAASYFSSKAYPTGPEPAGPQTVAVIANDVGSVVKAGGTAVVDTGKAIVSGVEAIPGAIAALPGAAGNAVGDFFGGIAGGILKQPAVLLLAGLGVYVALSKK